jgi:hypothetical protein
MARPISARPTLAAASVVLLLAGCGEGGGESAPIATCSDGARNGAETDVDCGGGTCRPCADGLACGLARDCGSGVCNATCQAATCTDGVKNGAETDADCGGGACLPCAAGGTCTTAADCTAFACPGTCPQAPSCADGVRNGQETDADCGGPICSPCTAGQACARAVDCATLLCTGGACVAAAASCSNGVVDGTETDVDCGGGACGACSDGRTCAVTPDCRGTCTAGHTCCRSTRTLVWDAPQQTVGGACATSLAGFRFYFGSAPGTYEAPVDLPLGSPELRCAENGTSGPCGPVMSCAYAFTITQAGIWYLATTAYDRAGVESVKSSEISVAMVPCP